MLITEITTYHGTNYDIAKFRSLTHFGSLKAANDRLAYKKINGKIYKVELDINNPAIIKDFAGVHTPRIFAFALKAAKILSQDEMLSVSMGDNSDDSKAAQLIKLLKSTGYDGIAYKNRHEDKGHTSYVILDSDQAKIVDTVAE